MKIKLTIILFFVFAQFIGAQESDMRTVDENTGIISGRLENDFRYFIKPLDNYKGKILTKFVVNAGSQMETKDQYSVAHLLEHLVFKGTENFPSLSNNPEFYSQLNLEPQDFHAHISGSQTNYNIDFPQGVTNGLDTALAVYHDIASGKVLFEENVIDGERKAVYHEGTDGVDLGSHYPFVMITQHLSGCEKMPPFEKRKEVILNSSTKALIQFYKEWYRPDLMSLIIVGHIKNVKEVEEKIIKKFKDLPKPKNPPIIKDCKKSYLSSPSNFIVEDDLSLTSNTSYAQASFEFYFRNPKFYFKEFSENENKLIWEILGAIIDKRLNDGLLAYGTNYYSTIMANNYLPAIKLVIKTTGNEEMNIKRVFKMLSSTSYGFQKEEWEKLLNKKIQFLDNSNSISPKSWMDELQNQVSESQTININEDQGDIAFLESLEPEKLNQLLEKINWFPDDIAMVIPKRIDKASLSRPKIENWISSSLKKTKRYVSIKTPQHLITPSEISQLKEAEIIERTFGDFNEDIIRLENGVKIILKDLKPDGGRNQDKIMIHGFSPYGAECFGERDMESLFSPFIIKNSGVGKYNKFEIDQFLSKTSIPLGIRNFVDQTETSIKTEVSPEDLEIALQLIYLSFNQPRFDEEAFEDWKLQEAIITRRNINSNNDFRDFIFEKSGVVKVPQGGGRYQKSLKVNYRQAFEKFKALHANAKNFTFILTGDFNKKNALPLLQKYLGNLKNTGQNELCKNIKHNSSNPENLSYEDGKLVLPYPSENTILYTQYRSGWVPGDVKEEIRFQFLISAIDKKLKDLRFNKNFGTYFAVASSLHNYRHKNKYLQLLIHTTPEDFKSILKVCGEYIAALKETPVSEEFLEMTKKTAYLPLWEDRFENTNRAMQMRLYNHARYNLHLTDIEEIQRYMDEFSVEDLQQSAKDYFKEENKRILTASGSNIQ